MPEVPDEDIKDIHDQLAELVRRALVETADLQDVEAKLKDIVERSSKITPPPEPT